MCAGKVWQREIAKVISISDVVKSISGPLFQRKENDNFHEQYNYSTFIEFMQT